MQKVLEVTNVKGSATSSATCSAFPVRPGQCSAFGRRDAVEQIAELSQRGAATDSRATKRCEDIR